MHSKRGENIDNLLKQSLNGLTAKTSEKDWTAIMDDLAVIEKNRGSGRRRRFYLILSSASLISIFLASFFFLNNKSHKISNIDNSEITISSPNDSQNSSNSDFISEDTKNKDNQYSKDNPDKTTNTEINSRGSFDDKDIIKEHNNKPIVPDKSLNDRIEGDVQKDYILVEKPDLDNAKELIPDRNKETGNDVVSEDHRSQDSIYDSDLKNITSVDKDISLPLNSDSIDKKDPGSAKDDKIDHVRTKPKINYNVINAKGLKLSFNISPTYHTNNVLIDPENEKQIHRDYQSTNKASERESYGYAIGIGAGYDFAKFMSVNTGINYTSIIENFEYKYKIKDIPVIDEKTNNIIAYIPRTDTISVVSESQNIYNYVEIPLELGFSYSLGDRLGLGLNMGVSFISLLNANGSVISDQSLRLVDLESDNSNSLRLFNYKWNLGAGLLYQLNNNIGLAIEPEYHQLIKSVYDNNYPIQKKDYSYGISATILWKIYNKR